MLASFEPVDLRSKHFHLILCLSVQFENWKTFPVCFFVTPLHKVRNHDLRPPVPKRITDFSAHVALPSHRHDPFDKLQANVSMLASAG